MSSGLHENARFPERNLPGGIFTALNDPQKYNQQDRYPVSKTIGLLWTRELAARVPSAEVVINSANPGFCKTGLSRQMKGMMAYAIKGAELALGRSPEDGARCLVDAAVVKGEDTHGKYVSEMRVKPESKLVRSAEGEKLQKKIWEEIIAVLGEKAGLEGSSVP